MVKNAGKRGMVLINPRVRFGKEQQRRTGTPLGLLAVGAESGSQRILELIDKHINIAQVIDFNRRVKTFDLIPKYCFMMGFPTETLDDIKATLALTFRSITPIWPTHPLVTLLARLYRPFARKRVKRLFYKFPLEIKLAEWLGLYPEQRRG